MIFVDIIKKQLYYNKAETEKILIIRKIYAIYFVINKENIIG